MADRGSLCSMLGWGNWLVCCRPFGYGRVKVEEILVCCGWVTGKELESWHEAFWNHFAWEREDIL
jgi:hypothetical protein